jgi:hypothetical protein
MSTVQCICLPTVLTTRLCRGPEGFADAVADTFRCQAAVRSSRQFAQTSCVLAITQLS